MLFGDDARVSNEARIAQSLTYIFSFQTQLSNDSLHAVPINLETSFSTIIIIFARRCSFSVVDFENWKYNN